MRPRTRLQVARSLRAARKDMDLSQAELAEAAKVKGGPITVAHWESGRRQPNLDNFARLCIALDLDPTETLIHGWND